MSWMLAILASAFLAMPIPQALADHVLTGPRPGDLNPIMDSSKWILFQDDELITFFENPDNNSIKTTSLDPASHDLQQWEENSYKSTIDHNVNGEDWKGVSVAAGRVTQPDTDQLVRAYIQSNGDPRIDLMDAYHTVLKHATIDSRQDDGHYSRVRVRVVDVDLETDENGVYHDEIVVMHMYKYDTHYYAQAVIYDKNLDILGRIEQKHWDTPRLYRMEVGDFNGDGLPEIASVIAYSNNDVSMRVFWYDPQNKEMHKADQYNFHYSEGFSYGFDTAAGDFNGDGRDDLVILGYLIRFYNTPAVPDDITEDEYHKADYLVFRHRHSSGTDESRMGWFGRIVSGLFYLNPQDGYGMHRRQIAVVSSTPYNDYGPAQSINYLFYKVDNDFHLSMMGYDYINYSEYGHDGKEHRAQYRNWEATAGNFVGHMNDNTDPTMQVAIAYQEIMPRYPRSTYEYTNSTGTSKVSIIALDSAHKPYQAHTYTGDQYTKNNDDFRAEDIPEIGSAIVALDRDGNTYRLGAPIRITFEDYLNLETILQEPPKHVDFLPLQEEGKVDWDGKWEVVNVNAYPQFNVQFRYENESEMEMESKSVTSTSYGGSATISGQKSVKVNALLMKGAITIGAKFKAGRNNKEDKTEWDNEYHSRSTGLELETSEDDILYGAYQLIDIWRYRVYGAKTEDRLNLFQEIIMPGPFEDFHGGGLNHWSEYQPRQINRNLLSYPDVDENYPPDVGSFKLPNGDEVHDVMTPNTMIDYDANASTITLEWTDKAGSGSSKLVKNTFHTSQELSVSYKGKAGVPKVGHTETKWSVKGNAHYSKSTVNEDITSISTSETRGFTIEVPDIPLPSHMWAFRFKPSVYVSEGGVLKCTHAVDFDSLTDVGPNWARYYGSRPDPGLALPYRFEYYRGTSAEFGKWELVKEPIRMFMRGFYMRHHETDPISGEHNLYAETPVDGDLVNLSARVYNFCLSDWIRSDAPLKVRFEYQLIDTKTNEEIEMPDGRIHIGDAAISELAPRAMAEATVVWDTTGLSNTIDPETGELENTIGYRIYVTLDPNDTIKDEVHEWKDASLAETDMADHTGRLYHGNNEGYWPYSGGIIIKAHQDPDQPLQASAAQANLEASVSVETRMHETALAVKTKDGLTHADGITLRKGKRYSLRAHIQATGHDTKNHLVLFYDAHPHQEGKVIAIARTMGLAEDCYVWADWTPEETGEFELWAAMVEPRHETDTEDARDSIRVTVSDQTADESSSDDDDTCMIRTVMPDSSAYGVGRLFAGLLLLSAILFLAWGTRRGTNH